MASTTHTSPDRTSKSSPVLRDRFLSVRAFSRRLVEPLSPEDCVVQSMPDASPMKWHLAHTTWFFETFVLARQPGYLSFDSEFKFLFNSYYNQVGDQFPRPERGLISRPGLDRVLEYREHIDRQMTNLMSSELPIELSNIIEVGLHHEQQHQELMLTDIKHVLSCNPLLPAYQDIGWDDLASETGPEVEWLDFDESLVEIGHDGKGFCFDNELPRHRVFLEPFAIATQPVTNQTVLDFIADGGYERPDHWLSLGWSQVEQENWTAPLYWLRKNGCWMQFTLAGLREIEPHAPACHLSYFEADAIARWKGCRLPTEFEWESAAVRWGGDPNADDQFADQLWASGRPIHPTTASEHRVVPCQRMFGSVWEWTSSSYAAFPGYQPPPGALGEYNGKFMCNQYVLRGGSVATSRDHIRTTYRNFFPPSTRWQFSGFRLAKSL